MGGSASAAREAMDRPVGVRFEYGRDAATLHAVAADTPLGEVGRLLAERWQLDPATLKLLVPGRKGLVRPADAPNAAAGSVGVRPGARPVKVVASRAADVEAVRAAREPARAPGFEHEARREARRRAPAPPPSAPPAGPYSFGRLEEWRAPGLSPPPGEARALLARLAGHPGVAAVMAARRWAVGVLSEMPPQGKVGVSPVCLLGVNVGRGREVSLRLRTDDLRGFRAFDRILETLVHELAHMEVDGHGVDFRELNSRLRREVAAAGGRGRATGGGGPAYEGRLGGEPELEPPRPRAAGGGGRVGGGRAAAGPADAALRRAAAAGGGAPPASPPPPQQQQLEQPHEYKKGDAVRYTQRDGSTRAARVVAVDLALRPPSYGIEFDDEPGSFRETEGGRLAPAPPPLLADGGGHYDPETERLEAEVRRLEGRG